MIRLTQGPIARGTIRTSFVLGLRLVVQAGTLLLVARMLGPREFGAFAGVAALAVIMGTLSTFGTHLVLAGEVAKEPSRRNRILAYAIPTTTACGALLLVIYLLICLFFLNEAAISFVVLLAIGATETLVQPLFGLTAWEHLSLGRIARSQLLTVMPLALRLVAAVIVFAMHPNDPLTLYGYGYFVASALALSVGMLTMPARWPPVRQWRLLRKAEMRNAAGYAALAFTNMGSVELDKTLASKLLPLSASGVYAAAARVLGASMLPVLAMITSALPRLFREGEENSWRTARLLRWLFAVAFAYSIVLAVILWVMAPVFVWLFGVKYQGLQHVIHLLCLALPGLALRKVAGNVLMGLGSPWGRVQFEVIGLLSLVVASAWLAPKFGVTGMAIALTLSEWVMTIAGCTAILLARRRVRKEG